MSPRKRRIAWIAGTRGEILRLGPLYKAVFAPRDPLADVHWFVATGEQGMAAAQALDELEIAPHEEFELRNPSDDPAIRLHELMRDIERFLRRSRATHAVFAGSAPTAAATALVCHGRRLRGLWLRSADGSGLNPRQNWEGGLERIIAALLEGASPSGCVTALEGISFPARKPAAPPRIEGRREGAPLAMIAVGRMLWGMQGVYGRLVQACQRWAAEAPEADWLILRSLDWHLEGPLGSMESRPPNLLSLPPLPYSEYAALLAECHAALTDSPSIATECMGLGIPVAALGEKPAEAETNPRAASLPIAAADLASAALDEFFRRHLLARGDRRAPGTATPPPAERFAQWLAEAPAD